MVQPGKLLQLQGGRDAEDAAHDEESNQGQGGG